MQESRLDEAIADIRDDHNRSFTKVLPSLRNAASTLTLEIFLEWCLLSKAAPARPLVV